MKKRTVLAIVLLAAVAAALWFGGGYLWHLLLAMHGRR
jgi:hypothetical protein